MSKLYSLNCWTWQLSKGDDWISVKNTKNEYENDIKGPGTHRTRIQGGSYINTTLGMETRRNTDWILYTWLNCWRNKEIIEYGWNEASIEMMEGLLEWGLVRNYRVLYDLELSGSSSTSGKIRADFGLSLYQYGNPRAWWYYYMKETRMLKSNLLKNLLLEIVGLSLTEGALASNLSFLVQGILKIIGNIDGSWEYLIRFVVDNVTEYWR